MKDLKNFYTNISLSILLVFCLIFFNSFWFSTKSEQLNFPIPTLKHLLNLTDDTGIFEHAIKDKPNKQHGYCVEDVGRALIAVLMFYKLSGSKYAENLADIYLNYIKRVQRKDGEFHHRMDKNHNLSKRLADGDAYGRILWGLGYAIAYPVNTKMRITAKKIFDKAILYLDQKVIKWPRAISYAIPGLYFYLKQYPDTKNIKNKLVSLANKLVESYRLYSDKDWRWFDKIMTYDNARIPYALFLAYKLTKNKKYLDIAKESLNFLLKINFSKGNTLYLIGNKGWLKKGKKPIWFDQQPIDAAALVETCGLAYQILKQNFYKKRMIDAFYWFFGKNAIKKPLFDPLTGGCRDGLSENGVNLNEGAESSIMYLIARLTIMEILGARQNSGISPKNERLKY